MQEFRVSKEMYPYFQIVAKRDGIDYKQEMLGEEYKVQAEMDGTEFEIVMEDASCEEQRLRRENNPFYPVYSYRTLMNEEKLARLRKYYKCNNYFILEKDEEKYKEAMGWR